MPKHKRVIRCSGCSRTFRGRGKWNLTFRAGVAIGATCPACQTPEQNAEAEINEATTDYRTSFFDGRVMGFPKT